MSVTVTIERWRCVTHGKRAVIATMQIWRRDARYFVTLVPAGMPVDYVDPQEVELRSKVTALATSRDRRREFRSSALVRWEKIYP